MAQTQMIEHDTPPRYYSFDEIEALWPNSEVHRMDGYLYCNGVAYRHTPSGYRTTEQLIAPMFDRMLTEAQRGTYMSHLTDRVIIHTLVPKHGLVFQSEWTQIPASICKIKTFVRVR